MSRDSLKGNGLLPAPSWAPRGVHPRDVLDAIRRTSRAGIAGPGVGLGRRTPNEPERLPLDRPSPCGSGGRKSRALFTCTATAPHPVDRCERDLPRERRVSHLGLSSLRTPSSCLESMPTGKIRLSNFCNRLTTRAPAGPTSSRVPPLAEPCGPSRGGGLLPPEASARPRVERALDGDAPASALPRLPLQTFRAETPKASTARTPRGPGGASIAAPPRWVSRRRHFLPRTELVTQPLTSSVAARWKAQPEG